MSIESTEPSKEQPIPPLPASACCAASDSQQIQLKDGRTITCKNSMWPGDPSTCPYGDCECQREWDNLKD